MTPNELLSDLSLRLAAHGGLSSRLADLLEQAMRALDTDKGSVQLYDRQDESLKILCHRGFPLDFIEYFHTVDCELASPWAEALARRDAVLVEDVLACPDYADLAEVARRFSFRSVYSMPMYDLEGGILGVLSLHYSRPRAPSPQAREALGLYAAMGGHIIDAAQSRQGLQLYGTILKQMNIALIGIERGGQINYWNEAASRYYGLSSEMVRGRSLDSVFGANSGTDILQEKTVSGQPHSATRYVVNRNQEAFWIEVSSIPLHNERGELEGYLQVHQKSGAGDPDPAPPKVFALSPERDAPIDRLAARNLLLAGLPPEEFDMLAPHMGVVDLPLNLSLNARGEARAVYFVLDGLVSLLMELSDGGTGELALVGAEGMVGLPELMQGLDSGLLQTWVQSAGRAIRVPVTQAREAIQACEVFQSRVMSFSMALMFQIAQTALCNRHHSIHQHFARWLLLSLDGLGTQEGEVTMTQEMIAAMIGVRREGVNITARNYQDLGIIAYSRGRIRVLDRGRLEDECCECYGAVKRAYSHHRHICNGASASRD